MKIPCLGCREFGNSEDSVRRRTGDTCVANQFAASARDGAARRTQRSTIPSSRCIDWVQL